MIVVKSPLDMEVVGQTIDDAAGEAFDKAACGPLKFPHSLAPIPELI